MEASGPLRASRKVADTPPDRSLGGLQNVLNPWSREKPLCQDSNPNSQVVYIPFIVSVRTQQLLYDLFIMTTCFGQCRPSSGHQEHGYALYNMF